MRPCLMIFALLLSACLKEPKTIVVTQIVVPEVDPILLETVTVPQREIDDLASVGLILTDHVEALDRANGQIQAIRSTLEEARLAQGQ